MSANTNFPTTKTPRTTSGSKPAPMGGIDASDATPEYARDCLRTHRSGALLKDLTAARALTIRGALQASGAYLRSDVEADPAYNFLVANSRQMIKLMADELAGSEAVAVAAALVALTDHPFQFEHLTPYFEAQDREFKRRMQNREAQRRTRARKAGAA